MRSVALLFFKIHLAFAGTRYLHYLGTVVYRNSTIPEITLVGMVDNEEYMCFNSNTMKTVPTAEWIKQNVDADYWKSETEETIAIFKKLETDTRNVMDLFKQPVSGIHTFQEMYSCELDDNGTTRGYLKFAYDGEDFIIFDKDKLSWIAAIPEADITKNKWNADRAQSERWKAYLEYECIKCLKKFVNYKDSLERKVPPEVFLLQKNSSSPVTCHATSFYPRNITMTWKKNNKDHYEDVEVGKTLPNADGSYQKSIRLSVNPEEWKKNPDEYRCVIQHVGAEKEIVVLLNENNIKTNAGSDNIIVKWLVMVIVTIAVGCLLAAAVFAANRWKKSREVKRAKSTGYAKGSTTETALE